MARYQPVLDLDLGMEYRVHPFYECLRFTDRLFSDPAEQELRSYENPSQSMQAAGRQQPGSSRPAGQLAGQPGGQPAGRPAKVYRRPNHLYLGALGAKTGPTIKTKLPGELDEILGGLGR